MLEAGKGCHIWSFKMQVFDSIVIFAEPQR